VAAKASASMGGSVAAARSAVAKTSASTGGGVATARSMVAQPSANMVDGITDASSALGVRRLILLSASASSALGVRRLILLSAATGIQAGVVQTAGIQAGVVQIAGILPAGIPLAEIQTGMPCAASTGGSRTAVRTAVPSNQSETLRGSTLLLSNTRPKKAYCKYPSCSTL